jgi:NAD(P)-dependent dehydrogenase (short-subunit alcohol dehydrogenase family)
MKKIILITGCSSGIGLCCAKGLKARGHRVFATARKLEDVRKLEKLGLESLPLDINDSASIKSAIKTICDRTDGKLDVLFNNCSYAQAGATEDLTREVIRAQFETNLFGPMELTNQVIKIMRKQGSGRIIFTGSLLGYITMPFRSAYNASKFALEGLVNTLRQELRNSKISVSIIEPGPIHSKIRENAKDNFLQNIDHENSAHKKTYEKMAKEFFEINAKESFYLPPDAVLKKLIHAVENKKPKTHYYVGFPSHFFMLLKRALPAKALDWVIYQIVKKEI